MQTSLLRSENTKPLLYKAVNTAAFSAASPLEILAPASNRYYRLYAVNFGVSLSGRITLQDDDSLVYLVSFIAAGGNVQLNLSNRFIIVEATNGLYLYTTNGSSAQAGCSVYYEMIVT